MPITSEQFAAAFPFMPPPVTVAMAGTTADSSPGLGKAGGGTLNLPTHQDGLDIQQAIQEIRAGHNLHNNARDLVASAMVQGSPDWVIEAGLTNLLAPMSDGGTIAQIPNLIASARRKFQVHGNQLTGIAMVEEDSGPFCANALTDEPPVRQWLIKDWIKLNTVNALYGDGGAGKSLLAQQLATCVSKGIAWLGMETKQMPVLCVMCEDDPDEVHIRQAAINRGCGVENMNQLPDLHFWTRVGHENLMVTYGGDGIPQLSNFHKTVIDQANQLGAKLIIMDTVTDFFGGNEIDRSQVNHFIKHVMGSIAAGTEGTVLQLAHPSMSGKASGSGFSGSTAWNNSVRSRIYLEKPENGLDEERIMTRKKSNYAISGDSTDISLFWENGILRLVSSVTSDSLDRMEFNGIRNTIMTMVRDAWDAGQPYKKSKKVAMSLDKCVVTELTKANKPKALIAQALKDLKESEDIIEGRTSRMRGWKTLEGNE